MPNSMPADRETFIITGTTAQDIDALSADNVTCGICLVPYGDVEGNDGIAEGPVKIKTCGHLFGRNCLENHIAGVTDSSRKFPLCRATLYTASPESFIERLDNEVFSDRTLELVEAMLGLTNPQQPPSTTEIYCPALLEALRQLQELNDARRAERSDVRPTLPSPIAIPNRGVSRRRREGWFRRHFLRTRREDQRG